LPPVLIDKDIYRMMFQIAYRRLLIAQPEDKAHLSDQQSPIRNLEHRFLNILINRGRV